MSDGGSSGSGRVPEVLLGVLASDVRLAVRSLRDYCEALGLPLLVSGGLRRRRRWHACHTCVHTPSPPPPPPTTTHTHPHAPPCPAPSTSPHPPHPRLQAPESRVPGVAAAPAIVGAVYVKYNSATALCYCTRYEGRDRGVLVQLGRCQLGHLPLGLHDEAMARPPPPSTTLPPPLSPPAAG